MIICIRYFLLFFYSLIVVLLGTKTSCDAVSYVVFIDGLQTVLLFSQNEEIIEKTLNTPSSTQSTCRRVQLGIPDVGLSIVNDVTREELLYISLNKSKVQWVQMRKSRVKPFSQNIQTHLEQLYVTNLQKIDENPYDESVLQMKYQMNEYREVTFHADNAELITQKGERKLAKRLSLHGLWIEYTWSMTNTALYARINRIQIDNQLDCTNFPSMLYPILSKTAASDAEKPFVELSIYESKTAQSNIMHFQYCKLLIQEFALRIDQGLILAILAFLRQEKNAMTPVINMDTDLEHIHKSLRAIIKSQTDTPMGESQMYFDNIHLSPLKIHVSFSMHGSKLNEELFAEYPLVGFLLRTLNVAEVQDVILRLGFYERSFDRFTVTKLKNEVSAHYQNQFLKQIHVLVLGLDVLGNPLGIIRGLAEGVESLFYEPYKGAIEGPLEFAEGVATGVLTLVGSTVGTAAGAVSRITGVIGQSLATLTFDDEYKASRIRRREPAANAVTDIASGGKNVVMGFFNGVTGVVTKPVTGAMKGGASGFVKGLGKGIVGLVAKPTGGIIDFASTSLDLVKRTATQEQVVRRIRYPRHVGRDGLVRSYIAHEAMGLYILNRLEKGKYAKTDTYVAHITCSDSPPSWLMATSKRILFVTEISFLGIYDIDWKMNYTELQQIPTVLLDKQVIQILVKKPPTVGALEANRLSGKLVKYRSIDEAHYLVGKITNAMHSIGL